MDGKTHIYIKDPGNVVNKKDPALQKKDIRIIERIKFPDDRYVEFHLPKTEKIEYSDRGRKEEEEQKKVELERTENLKQVALKARDEMENAKSYLDVSLLERYGFKKEYIDLQNQEAKASKCLQDGAYQEASEIFERVRLGYKGLDKQGISTRFRIEVIPPSIDFGNALSGEKVSRTITISNIGMVTIGLRSISIRAIHRNGDFQHGSDYGIRIRPGESFNWSLTWEAYAPGVDMDGYLTISLNDPMSSEVRVPFFGKVSARQR